MPRPAPGALDHVVNRLALTTPRASGGGGARPNGGGMPAGGGGGGVSLGGGVAHHSPATGTSSSPVLVDGPETVVSGESGSMRNQDAMDLDADNLSLRDGGSLGSYGVYFATQRPPSGSPLGAGKLYALSRLPEDLDAFQGLCRSVKGRGNKTFCLEYGCKTNHQGPGLVSLLPGDLFVVSQQGKVGFTTPTLPRAAISDDLLAEFLTSQRTLEEWKRDFERVMTAREDSFDGRVTKRDYEVVVAEEAMANSFKAPKTPRPEKRAREQATTDAERESLISGPEVFDGLTTSDERTTKLIDLFQLLDKDMGKLFSDTSKSSLEREEDISRIQQAVGNLYLKIKMLKRDTIGSCPPELEQEFGSASLWGAMAILAERMGQHPQVGSAPPSPDQDMSVLIHRLANVESDLYAVATGTQKEVEALRDEVGNSPAVTVGEAPQTSIKALQGQINELRSAVNTKAIAFGGLGFESVDAAGAWLELHLPSKDVGLFTDPHTVMEHVFVSGDADFLKDFEKVNKLGMLSLGKSIAMKSFQQPIPKFFCKQETLVVSADGSYFSRIPNVAHWVEPNTGHLVQLRRALINFDVGQREAIDMAFGSSSEVRAIALLSLSESVAFVTALLDFMKEYMHQLTTARFTETKAYHVATRVVCRIWKELFKPRQGVAQSFVTTDHHENARQIFWSSLRSLDIAVEIRRIGFENHHLVASELVKFLTAHSGSNEVGGVLSKLSTLENAVAQIRTSVNGAQSAANTASNKANEALQAARGEGGNGGNGNNRNDSRAIKTLKDDVKKLQERLAALEGARPN